MDSQEADASTTRVKVDFVKQIKGKESKWKHRNSLAWDTAFFTNPGVLDPEELFGSLKIDENEIDVESYHKHSIKILPSETTDARPSFSWDNAFFTDPGVLDAEELSLVNNGFTSSTQLRKSADSMTTTTTQGSRFSVTSIESDLFHDLRASSRDTRNVKETVTKESQHKLPCGRKRTKCNKQKDQPLSLIPQPKVSSSSFSSNSISKPVTPRQGTREKKCVASEIGRNRGKHKNHGFEEHSGSKSNIRSSYSSYTVKNLTSSSSSGLRLPLPKMDFFESENGEKENREPNAVEPNKRMRHKSKLETSSTPENRSVLGQRKTRK